MTFSQLLNSSGISYFNHGITKKDAYSDRKEERYGEQIAFPLGRADLGLSVAAIIGKLGIGELTRSPKKPLAGLGVGESGDI